MKCIFAKYNSERLPKYQIVTKIVQDNDGKKYSTKEAVLDEANEHLNDIFNNYKLLNENYDINLVKPERKDNKIFFTMAEGISLEKLMLQAVDEGNVEIFESLVKKYYSFVDTFVSKKEVIFEPGDEFKSIFGEWENDEPQDIINIANIDLVLSNIFVHNDQFTLIDYEWVFKFEIPKSYIVWRAFATFSSFHNIDFTKYSFSNLFSKNQNKMFEKLDINFSSYVRGEDKKYFLNSSVAKANVDLNLNNKVPNDYSTVDLSNNYHDLFIQLYLDTGQGFNDEVSIKIPISNNKDSQEIIFDLNKYENIQNIRLDPLNSSCVVEVDEILLVNDNKEINLFDKVTSNNCTSHGKKYFFYNDDPQIYFNDLKKEELLRVNKLKIKVRFVYKGKEAIYECVEFLQKKNHQNQDIIETQTVHEKELQKVIDNQQDTIDTQTVQREVLQKIILKKEELSQRKTIINRLRRFIGVYKSYQFCRAELPNDFTKFFDNNGYLKANPDVVEAVENGLYKSGLEHFCLLGFDEIFKGERILLEDLPFYNDDKYKAMRSDVTQQIYNGTFLYSHYVHYLLHGHKEIKPISTYSFYEPVLTAQIEEELNNFNYKPLISIIMPVYNVEPKWLSLAIKSIKNQWYDNWELCIADDKSTNRETIDYLKNINNSKIKITFLEKNGNISVASNQALSLAQGEYIALMDNDDELTLDALYEVVKVINENGSEFIYSDEDKINEIGEYSQPHFKPDYSPEQILSQNYMSHLGVIKKSLVNKVEGFTVGMEGAQDYDLYLKVLEQTNKIHHIPKVLYHWRMISGSTSAGFTEKSYVQDAGQQALKNAIKRQKLQATVINGKYPGSYRVKYLLNNKPLVSIIIPFKDKPDLLDTCISSILSKSTYQNYEIIGINNNSEEQKIFKLMEVLESKDSRIRFVDYPKAFNYSAINNFAVSNHANGEQLILLNNDIEIISPDWIENLLEFSQQENIGAVGCMLYYPNDTIQHAGIIIGIGGIAGHSHKYLNKQHHGYFTRPHVIQNVSAVTAACLMIKKSLYKKINGLNEDNLSVAFNDVDFCLRLKELGQRNVFTPFCEAYHYESISRGSEHTAEKQKRFNSEIDYMSKRHEKILKAGDPYYNSNLTLEREDFSLK